MPLRLKFGRRFWYATFPRINQNITRDCDLVLAQQAELMGSRASFYPRRTWSSCDHIYLKFQAPIGVEDYYELVDCALDECRRLFREGDILPYYKPTYQFR